MVKGPFFKILHKGEKDENGKYISAYSSSTALYNGSKQGLRYELGLNIDPLSLELYGKSYNGLYFTTLAGIEEFMFAYGEVLAELEIPEDEEIIPCYGRSYRSKSVIIKNFFDLYSNTTWEMLLQKGFRPHWQSYVFASNIIEHNIDCMLDIIDFKKYDNMYLNKWLEMAIENENKKAQNILEKAISYKK